MVNTESWFVIGLWRLPSACIQETNYPSDSLEIAVSSLSCFSACFAFLFVPEKET